ncbi:uncharacterized protein LOC121805995 [Salvia splendens]|uniref:uncharacterized protein LOC121805995 n=1 Tax=Salvia splendens TaxID=180675 RepID=UPI001C270742|nr:uncharacterized protein LOC121805995 [Salvia splendens]
MEGRDPARPTLDAYESLAEYLLRAYRSYRPYDGEGILPILCRFYVLWERTHEYGTTELDGIHQLISVLPDEWRVWAAWMSSSYIYRRVDTQEMIGDFRGFISFIFLQYVHFQDVPPVAEGDFPPPPLQWSMSTPPEGSTLGRHDHEAGPSRHPGTPEPERARHDPEGRGKAPMVVADEDESPGEVRMTHPMVAQERAPERVRQAVEAPEPPPAHPWVEDLLARFRQQSEERMAWLQAIRAEMDLEEVLFPMVAAPPPALEDMPGAALENPILVVDSDDDFEGSSGLSSLGSDEER